jgi:outer membrane protein OmpA-like peptidoglycan-associated protein
MTSLATNGEGRFEARDLPEGQYAFTAHAEGYKDGECAGIITKDAKEAQVDCSLEALAKAGMIVGKVRDADTNQPIASAEVRLVDPNGGERRVTADSNGGFRFESVGAGNAQVVAEAEGYLTQAQPVEVKVRVENNGDVTLKKRPKNANVRVERGEITIKQQIQFATDSAVILPDSFPLMNEIADAIIKHPGIRKIEIQGHTDNVGSAEHNKILSEDRANSVRTWLVAHGVQESRLVARGYGQNKPLVPNVTAGNRARNRRVQFIIVDQDGGGGGEAPSTPKPKEPQKNPLILP